jgi:hypothetical protein
MGVNLKMIVEERKKGSRFYYYNSARDWQVERLKSDN